MLQIPAPALLRGGFFFCGAVRGLFFLLLCQCLRRCLRHCLSSPLPQSLLLLMGRVASGIASSGCCRAQHSVMFLALAVFCLITLSNCTDIFTSDCGYYVQETTLANFMFENSTIRVLPKRQNGELAYDKLAIIEVLALSEQMDISSGTKAGQCPYNPTAARLSTYYIQNLWLKNLTCSLRAGQHIFPTGATRNYTTSIFSSDAHPNFQVNVTMSVIDRDYVATLTPDFNVTF